MEGLEEQQKGPQRLNRSGVAVNEGVQRGLDVFFLGVNLLCIYFYTLGIAFAVWEMEWTVQF
jgi:hypothetical protein